VTDAPQPAAVGPSAMAAADPAGALARPALGALWLALDAVPDPEIPAVSVVGLGILRGVAWDATDPLLLVVTVTPTYSGCPATELIVTSIRDAVLAMGVARVRIETRLAPAWTTDWMTAEARRKLRDFGIAPPDGVRAALPPLAIDVTGISPLRRAAAVACPRCESPRTQLVSQFGSTACKAHFRCLACLEPFDYFKPH
jgi:ring-1,2-phenylacetyl-CoA epoxidase subunit PaaD